MDNDDDDDDDDEDDDDAKDVPSIDDRHVDKYGALKQQAQSRLGKGCSSENSGGDGQAASTGPSTPPAPNTNGADHASTVTSAPQPAQQGAGQLFHVASVSSL